MILRRYPLASILLLTLLAISHLPLPVLAQPAETEDDSEIDDAGTEIHVRNADIAAIVKIFSKKTKRNYILDERVKGKISIHLPGKVSTAESIRILDALLALKGFSPVPIGTNLWKIVPIKEARQSTVPTRLEDGEDEPTAAVVTRLVQLQYVQAEEVQQLASQLVSPEGLISAYASTNSLILIDSEDNIQRIVHLIEALDVPSTDRDMTIIPVLYADAADIAQKLNDILGEPDPKASQQTDALDILRTRLRETAAAAVNVNGAGNAQAGGGAPRIGADGKVISPRQHAPKITADERTNSVIVVADEDTTARVRALISKLDSKVDLSGNRFYVYRCQHANAQELAEVLGGLTGAATSGGSSSSGGGLGGSDSGDSILGGGGTGSSGSRARSAQRSQQRMASQTRSPGQSRRSTSSGSSGSKSVEFSENLSITADPATNSLIVSANKTDWEKIKQLIDQLDVKRRQVLLEAVLLEVSVRKTEELGMEFLTSTGGKDGGALLKGDFRNLGDLLKDPTSLSAFSAAAASAGTLSLPNGITIPTQAVLVSAAQANSNANVLSSPNILATDNEPAEIVVGQNVPFVASRSSSEENLNNTFSQVERQDVGITLRFTPQISSADFVTLKVFTEVSSVIPTATSNDLGPTTAIRTSETTVIAKDGQMIVMGGLLSDDVTDSKSGVPILMDIPVLGHLFRYDNDSRERRNLLIFITPRVIKDQFDARDITTARRDTMEEHIASHKLFPSREDVLRGHSIDKVSESEPFEGALPSTITAPAHAEQPSSAAATEGTSGVMEFDVSPKLPTAAGEAPRAKLSERPVAVRETGDRFVVLELNAAPKGLIERLPFPMTPGQKTIGIELPRESEYLTATFFRAGAQLRYQVEGGEVVLTPVGIFSTAERARNSHPEVASSWYTLSPYEIMNLGSGPWLRGE